MSETPASPMTPNTTKSGRSARRIRKSKRIAAKIEMNTRKAKRTRHSARMDGCTPELKAAFAIMPPTPKNAAAVSAKEYPSPSRNGAAAGSTEGPQGEGPLGAERPLGCRPRRPRPGDPGAKRGFRSTPRQPIPCGQARGSVRLPVARIEEVVAYGSEAELRDERHDALVVVAPDQLADARDQLSVEAVFNELRGPQAPTDHAIEDEAGVGGCEAELALVRLSLPELRRRRLAHDPFGDTDGQRELAELRLVQITDRIDAACHVAELGSVAG